MTTPAWNHSPVIHTIKLPIEGNSWSVMRESRRESTLDCGWRGVIYCQTGHRTDQCRRDMSYCLNMTVEAVELMQMKGH